MTWGDVLPWLFGLAAFVGFLVLCADDVDGDDILP